ncbi:MAG TPA: F0F1 ATP synthase subunit alpha [Candidatus Omnitrophica bacterium]|nr:F0F1 ATP synthase subunit alpha [Candidatus Omnitrophota bacterium]
MKDTLFKIEPFEIKEVGVVKELKRGIARIEGLPSCIYGQLIEFGDVTGRKGLVVDFNEKEVMAFILGDEKDIKLGSTVTSRNEVFSIPVGENFLGRVINAIGEPIDDRNPHIENNGFCPVFRRSPGVLDRVPISEQFHTGTKILDSVIPIGRGQRELIIGDRQTGKTTIALDAIINQKDKNVFCVYCWIGGAHSSLMKIIRALEETGALDYTVVVAASASSSAGEQYLAPYVASAVGEYFMYSGRDSFVVFDDLTKHAWIYRELSLLLERSPGREAYPGDIFYLHSQLMERAGRLNAEKGSGSMTFFPIVETLQGDITGYIQSNLVSMTDGQIYISGSLFHEGFKPAIDLGLSVSRIGSKVQSEALREVSDTLRLDYAQYKELLRLMRVKTKLSTEIAEKLRRGEALSRILGQDTHQPVSELAIIILLYAFKRKILEILSPEGLGIFCGQIMGYLEEANPQVLKNLASQKVLSVETKQELDRTFVEFFRAKKVI